MNMAPTDRTVLTRVRTNAWRQVAMATSGAKRLWVFRMEPASSHTPRV